MEFQMIFQATDVSIYNSYIKDPIGTSTFYTNFFTKQSVYN